MSSMMSKISFLSLTSAVALTGSIAFAQEMPSQQDLLHMIQKQQEQLNQLQALLKKTQNQAAQASAKADEAKTNQDFLNSIQIGGALEFEATSSEDFNQDNTSDLSLAKAELSFSAKPHEYVEANIVAVYEDGADTINLDEATVAFGHKEEFPLYAQLGKWAVPFGNYDTAMSSDPLTLDLGEIKENAVLVGATMEGVTVEGFVYNGDTQQSGSSDHIDQFGLNVAYEAEVSGAAVSVGAGYINNIADSDGVNDKVNNADALSDYVGAMSLHGSVEIDGLALRAGYVKATDNFDAAELAFKGAGAQPRALSLEAAYTMDVMNKETTFALTYQNTDEALALELPETRVGGAVTVNVVESTSVTLEYLADEDYSTSEGGTGNNGHTATAKVAVEF